MCDHSQAITYDQHQLQAHPLACDVYSYAILAWQVLVGARPYTTNTECEGMSPHQIKQLVVGGLRPAIPKTVPSVAGASSDSGHNSELQRPANESEVWPAGYAELVSRCWAPQASAVRCNRL